MLFFLIAVFIVAVSVGVIALFKSDLDYEDYIEDEDENED